VISVGVAQDKDRSDESFLRPAFSTNRQISAFVTLMILILLLPALITLSGKVSRRDSYDLMSEEHGAYSFIASEIFDNKDDIDILFIGSSIQWNAVDTSQVEQALSDSLGRPARVVSFGFNFNGIDVPYFMLRDTLAHKRVRLVIFSIPRLPFNDGPNATAFKFLRYNEYKDASADLPFKYKAASYAAGILRSPSDLITALRKNRIPDSKLAPALGANKEKMGMGRDPSKFVEFSPQPPVVSPNELIFSGDTAGNFQFTDDDLPTYQENYLRELISLLKKENVPLSIINVPQYNERSNTKVFERFNWTTKFGENIPLIGIAPAQLFQDLTPDEVERLHCDPYHFNANGNAYFTHAVLPAIIQVYDRHANKTF
jgi:hypothetical protein